MKKSNKPAKTATEKREKVAKKKIVKSTSHPPTEDVLHPITKKSENSSNDKTVIKSSKINNPDNLNFDDDILNEDIDISTTDTSGFDDNLFENESDFYESAIDDF